MNRSYALLWTATLVLVNGCGHAVGSQGDAGPGDAGFETYVDGGARAIHLRIDPPDFAPPADGTTTLPLTVHAFDDDGAPVVGLVIASSSNEATDVLVQLTRATDATGAVLLELTARKPGLRQIAVRNPRAAAAVSVRFAATAPTCAGIPEFGQTAAMPVDTGAALLIAGDVDGDGHDDLVVPGAARPVFLGDGHGNFRNTGAHFSLTPAFVIGSGDLDGDGRTDVFVRGSVYFGVADGGLRETAFALPDSTAQHAIAFSAYDGGPRALVVTFQDPAGPSFTLAYPLSANGYFQSPLYVFDGGGGPVTAADFDGDGLTDLFGVWPPGLRRGRGDFTFEPVEATDAGFIDALATTDFDGDGLPDVIGAGVGVAYAFHNRGGGAFDVVAAGAQTDTLKPILFDEDGDGIVDAVFMYGNGDFGTLARVVRANAQAGFDAPFDLLEREFGAFVPGVAAALTSARVDGRSELFFLQDNGLTRVLPIAHPRAELNPDVEVLSSIPTPVPGPDALWATTAGEQYSLEADGGDLEVVARDGFVVVDETEWRSRVFGDWNGDGHADIAGFTGNGDLRIDLQLEDGGFQSMQPAPGLQFGRLVVGDVDGDGVSDLVGNHFIGFGHGDGTFDFRATDFAALALGDFDGDGWLDIVVSAGLERNVGNGSFRFVTEDWPVIGSHEVVGVADLDEDGLPDVVRAQSGRLVYWSGRPDGGAGGPLTALDTGTTGDSRDLSNGTFVVADLNLDGHPDIAATTQLGYAIWVATSQGDGGFGRSANFSVPKYGSALAVGDFDGDGRPDLASATAGARSLGLSGRNFVEELLQSGCVP